MRDSETSASWHVFQSSTICRASIAVTYSLKSLGEESPYPECNGLAKSNPHDQRANSYFIYSRPSTADVSPHIPLHAKVNYVKLGELNVRDSRGGELCTRVFFAARVHPVILTRV